MAGGKPSTWLPPGGLVEQSSLLYTLNVYSNDDKPTQMEVTCARHVCGIFKICEIFSNIMSHQKKFTKMTKS